MFLLAAYLNDRQARVNEALTRILAASTASPRIAEAMSYSLMAGGKRLRPILCTAAAEAVGAGFEQALPAACALELIHTYSLIHDDLPAMDDDNLRRGRPTCHVAFDEATAILAGDALLTLAFEILAAEGRQDEAGAVRYHHVIETIAAAAGHRGMIAGQMKDIAAEGRPLTLDALQEMYRLKTGALMEAAVRVGALVAGADAPRIEALVLYAKNIGLAFQIIDDILNVKGDPNVTGKASGTDATRRKSTYPALLGIDKSLETADGLVQAAVRAIGAFDEKAEPLRALAEYIIDRRK